MSKEILTYESSELSHGTQSQLRNSQSLPLGVAEVLAPMIVISRNQPAHFRDGEPTYGVNATYIEGYGEDGQLISSRSLQERSGIMGKVWQHTLEKWKLHRVEHSMRTLGRQAIVHSATS